MQELDFETKVDELGREQITVNTSIEKIRSLYQPYLKRITDTKLFINKIKYFIETINPYFYELYISILNILNDIGLLDSIKDMKHWSNILLFLKHKMVKKRVRRVGPIEDDWWIKKYNDIVMPKISKYRLPFLIFLDKNIETKEIIGKT